MLKLAPYVSMLTRNHVDMPPVPSGQTSLYLLYLVIDAILILIMSLMGVKLWAEQYKPHVLYCSYKPHETKGGGGKRRCGAPIQSRYVHIQTLSKRWPGLKHQTTTPKPPCVLTKDKWTAEVWWHHRNIDLVTVIYGIVSSYSNRWWSFNF